MNKIKNTNIITKATARESILKGLEKVNSAVSATMGPHGRTSAIVTDEFGTPKFTKDGYTVANAIFESDPFEGIGVGIIKDVVKRTVSTSGDGCTQSSVLCYEMFKRGTKEIRDTEFNVSEYRRGMVNASKKIVQELETVKSLDFDEFVIGNIAMTSSNGDEQISECIVDNYETFTTKKSFANIKIMPVATGETRIETVSGYRMDTRPLGAIYSVDTDRRALSSKNDSYLLFDTQVSNFDDFLERLGTINFRVGTDRTHGLEGTLFVVAPNFGEQFAKECIEAFKSGYNIVLILAPFFGEQQIKHIYDMSVMVNGKVQSYDVTQDTYTFDVEDFGFSKSSELTDHWLHVSTGVDKESGTIQNLATTLYLDFDEWEDTRVKRKDEYIKKLENDKLLPSLTPADVGLIDRRLASIHGVGINFYIQSSSELEVSERIDRAQDAIHAVISAFDNGYIAGGGTTLYKVANWLKGCDETLDHIEAHTITHNHEYGLGYMNVIKSAMKPFEQIIKNSGRDVRDLEVVYTDNFRTPSDRSGFNVLTGEFVDDMIREGIIDPVLVTISAIQNSVSSISTALTINAGLHISNDNSVTNKGFTIQEQHAGDLTQEEIEEMYDFIQKRETKEQRQDILDEGQGRDNFNAQQ